MKRKYYYNFNQVSGVLIGTFLGDSIGAKYNGCTVEEISPLDLQTVLKKKPSLYTDDTQMTISVFEEMVENGSIDCQSLGNRFLKRYSPWRGYDGGMLQVIERWKDGQEFASAANELYNGSGSFGDGAAMRSAPISCFFSIYEEEKLFNEVKKSAVLTHSHPLGIDGAILQAYAVLLALNNVSPEDWTTRFYKLPIDSAFKIKFGLIDQCIRKGATPAEIVEKIGNGSDALSAVPAAIYSVISNLESFLDAVLYAISLGGDTDTIGSMAGAIAGARFGISGIPEVLINQLENETEGKDFILDLAKNEE